MSWQASGQKWLEQAAHAEWIAQGKPRGKRGRYFSPPQWMQDAQEALGQNDEEKFKAIKLAWLSGVAVGQSGVIKGRKR